MVQLKITRVCKYSGEKERGPLKVLKQMRISLPLKNLLPTSQFFCLLLIQQGQPHAYFHHGKLCSCMWVEGLELKKVMEEHLQGMEMVTQRCHVRVRNTIAFLQNSLSRLNYERAILHVIYPSLKLAPFFSPLWGGREGGRGGGELLLSAHRNP